MKIEPSYRVEVDWSPVYELLTSLQAFFAKTERNYLDLGPSWAKRITEELGADVVDDIASLTREAVPELVELSLRACPARETIDDFLEWFAAEPIDNLLDTAKLYLEANKITVPRDIEWRRELTVALLTRWDDLYFSSVDPAVLDGLRCEADRQRETAQQGDPMQVVEDATQGVRYEPKRIPEYVLLVPQWHYRPWNIYGEYGSFYSLHYPADVLPPGQDELPLSLLRLTRALGDESRLRILRSIAEQPRSFTDLVRLTGLSKSTVNHHTVMLRAAGLITVHVRGRKSDMYSLRRQSLDDLGDRLLSFIEGGTA